MDVTHDQYIEELEKLRMETKPKTASVNSIKLTKLEWAVLEALSKDRYDYTKSKYPSGNNIEGIAETVYGQEVLNRERRGGHYCMNISICYAAKSALSRSLKSLFTKGLVKRAKPIYKGAWGKFEDRDGTVYGFYHRILLYLRAFSINDQGLYHIEEIQARRLPDRTHVWWSLTEKGKNLLKEALK